MSDFATFWSLYPRRQAKKLAEKAWEKNKCDDVADKIIEALKKQLPHMNDPKFVPLPASWINAGRWTDELHVDVRPGPVRAPDNFIPGPQSDIWHVSLNRVLLKLIMAAKGNFTEQTMQRLVTGKKHYAEAFRSKWGDGPAPLDEYEQAMVRVVKAFEMVIEGKA
jgi:hypothetical protein